MRFCRLTGAQPYLAANLAASPRLILIIGWSTATLLPRAQPWPRLRAAAGFPEPFNVRYWGVGNESWGCGGNLIGGFIARLRAALDDTTK